MNRRKSAQRTPLIHIISLFMAAAIATAGGVLHAYYKNRQIQVAREIDAIERRVGQYQLDIQTTKMRSDQLLNRFAIRKQLEDSGSALRPIPIGIIEEIQPAIPVQPGLATASVP